MDRTCIDYLRVFQSDGLKLYALQAQHDVTPENTKKDICFVFLY